MFIVPVQVSLQSRPPREEKGRMIATMNQFSWIGIILGAIVYEACIRVLERHRLAAQHDLRRHRRADAAGRALLSPEGRTPRATSAS